MATKLERLAALEKKQAQIKAQIQSLKARDSAKERKEETRRKVLVGAFVLSQMRKKGAKPETLVFQGVAFADTLKNDRDRELFGLAGLPALSPSGEAGGAVSNGG